MEKTIELEEEYNAPRKIHIHGVRRTGSLSAIDLPYAAKGSYDEIQHKFELKFLYAGPEEPEVIAYSDEKKGVSLFAGKMSGRLLRIKVERVKNIRMIPTIAVDAIVLVQKQIQNQPEPKWKEHRYPHMEWLNYAVARDFLEKQGSNFLPR